MGLRPVSNPPNPWAATHPEWLDAPPMAQLEIFEERAKSVLSENDSPDIGFRWSVNPYRGCFHACAYCYARPSHQYWDFGAGTDFESKIVVKVNAPEVLRAQMMKKSWQGESITFSGNTDCYQPLEASYRLTRQCLEVCAEFRNPVSLITKGALIRRDIDVLKRLAEEADAFVSFSIAFADDDMARKLEPHAPRPSTRLEAMRALSEAGIPVGVAVAPIIPGVNDSQVPEILARAKECGARHAFRVLLRLPREVNPVFFQRLAEEYPDRVSKVQHAIQDMRGGAMYDSRFGHRHKGTGSRWDAIAWLFDSTCKKLGIPTRDDGDDLPRKSTFRRPGTQLTLFE
jgi:DNA repair photolyase